MTTHSAPTLLDPNAGLNHSAGLPSLPAAPRRTARPLSLAATLAALAFAPFVDGAVVLSNLSGFSPTDDYVRINQSSASTEAVKVTTGPGSWTLNSVSIISYYSDASKLVIWAGASPGSIGTPTYVSSVNTGSSGMSYGTKTFTFSSVTLSGGTDYWFAAVRNTTGTLLWYYNSTATPSSAYGWTQSDQQTYTTSWAASSGRSYVSLAIDATQVPSAGVPDGTTTALLLAPLGLGLAWAGRRRG